MFQVEDLSSGEHKIVSRSKAVVIQNDDPQKKGRIRVLHPLLGETSYIPYLCAPGSFSVPDVGDVVYVECDCGYETHPIAWGNLNKQTDGEPDYPEEFQRVTPSNRGFFTPGGHLIELDDGKGTESEGQGVRITTANGNKISVLEDSTAPSGLITIETSGGSKITIDGEQDSIQLTTSSGNSLELSADNGFTTDVSEGQATISQNDGQVEVTGQESVTLKDGVGAELNLKSGKVALGNSSAELLDLINQALAQLITLTQTLSVEAPAGFGAVLVGAPTYLQVNTELTTIQTQLGTIKGSL